MEQTIKECKAKIKEIWIDISQTEEERINKEFRKKVKNPIKEYIKSCDRFIKEDQELKKSANEIESAEKDLARYAQLFALIFGSLMSFLAFPAIFRFCVVHIEFEALLGIAAALQVTAIAFFLLPYGIMKSFLFSSSTKIDKAYQQYQGVKTKLMEELNEVPLLLSADTMISLKNIHYMFKRDNVLKNLLSEHIKRNSKKKEIQSALSKGFHQLSNRQLFLFLKTINRLEFDMASRKITLDRLQYGFETKEEG